MEIDDAIQFIVEYLNKPEERNDRDLSNYGYGIYLPNVIHFYRKNVLGHPDTRFLGNDNDARELSPVFYEAFWELCRRGYLRPGVRQIGLQATDEGGSGSGYTITAAGEKWIGETTASFYISTEPSRFSKLISKFRDRFGDGFFQRSQEAGKCHFSTAYLACCVMCGAAAESVLLSVAINKSNENEGKVLREYQSSGGRRKIEKLIVGNLRDTLSSQFKNLTNLLNYWRDEAAHGTFSEISEFEAHEALTRLLRLSQFVEDHWEELTS